jgi:hypothetical protein
MLKSTDTQIQETLKSLLYLLNYEDDRNIVPAHTMKAYDGSRGRAPCILKVSGQVHALATLPMQKMPVVSTE